MQFIEIENVTKRYDDKLAVDNISLGIEKGEVFGLLGPNGAGKSTLISMICGLVNMDRGEIKVGQNSIKTDPVAAKRLLGLVPQEVALYDNISARDNLIFWGSMYGLKDRLLKERVDEALKTTGLTERSKEKISKFSGGMKRRLNIAAAIMHRPEVMIMDEPTVGIDPQSRNHILEFTKNLNKEYGTTIIYTSHYIEEVENLCSKVAILDEGKVIAYGTKEQITRMVTDEERLELTVDDFKDEAILRLKKISGIRGAIYDSPKISLVVRNSQMNLQAIIEALIPMGIKIRDISINAPNLETVFLSITGKTLRD